MGPDSQPQRLVCIGALDTDRFAAPGHGHLSPSTPFIAPESSGAGAASETPGPGPEPLMQENFLVLIGELSLRAVRSQHKP